MIIFTDKRETILFCPCSFYFMIIIIFFHFFLLEFSLIFHVTAISHRRGTAQYLTAAAWNQEWKRMTHLQNT